MPKQTKDNNKLAHFGGKVFAIILIGAVIGTGIFWGYRLLHWINIKVIKDNFVCPIGNFDYASGKSPTSTLEYYEGKSDNHFYNSGIGDKFQRFYPYMSIDDVVMKKETYINFIYGVEICDRVLQNL